MLILLSLIRGVTPARRRVLGFAVLGLVVAAPVSYITLKDRFGSNSMTTQGGQRPAFERSARAMSADHPMGGGANLYAATANLKGYADRAGVAKQQPPAPRSGQAAAGSRPSLAQAVRRA